MKLLLKSGIVGLMMMAAMPNFAQQATAEQKGSFGDRSDFGILHMQTKLGSFKIIDGEGRLEFSFTGTLLITSHSDGNVEFTGGKIRKEYEKNGRTVYTGVGRAVITGKWRGVQWFGKDMNGTFYGKGAVRLAGEFDRDLKTGDFWYEDKSKALPFPASAVITVFVPAPTYGADPSITPKVREGGVAGPSGGKTGGN